MKRKHDSGRGSKQAQRAIIWYAVLAEIGGLCTKSQLAGPGGFAVALVLGKWIIPEGHF